MKYRKAVALLLGMSVLLGSLTGCGSGEPAEEQGTQTAQKEGKEEAGQEEVPTIVIYNNSGAFSVTGAEAGSDESVYKEMQDYILQETGVKVEIIMPPSDGSAAAEKLNLLLAGGDQIDAWWGSWTDYASDGIILPLTDYVKAPEGQALYELWEP